MVLRWMRIQALGTLKGGKMMNDMWEWPEVEIDGQHGTDGGSPSAGGHNPNPNGRAGIRKCHSCRHHKKRVY
jgi:hypothetical protein